MTGTFCECPCHNPDDQLCEQCCDGGLNRVEALLAKWQDDYQKFGGTSYYIKELEKVLRGH